MEYKIGKFINSFFRLFGLELHTISKNEKHINENLYEKNNHQNELDDLFLRENIWLIDRGIKAIIDIGSNEGQFAEKFSHLFPLANFYCFEPLPDVLDVLEKKFSENKNFHFFKYALGEEDGSKIINRNEYSPSSSILSMKDAHKEAFDFARKETGEEIVIKKLDDIRELSEIEKPYLVKIDVQGYELPVIDGGTNIIKNADMIIIETSFVQLYEESPLFEDIYKKLIKIGFVYAGSFEQLKRPSDGKFLQQDAIFVKNGMSL